jgi:hypothetical protein
MQLTLGHVVTNENQLNTIWSSLKAISAGGNLVVVTFTVARGNEAESYHYSGI